MHSYSQLTYSHNELPEAEELDHMFEAILAPHNYISINIKLYFTFSHYRYAKMCSYNFVMTKCHF